MYYVAPRSARQAMLRMPGAPQDLQGQEEMTARLIRGDVMRFAAHYHGPKFHALLCDAPYEMSFMGKSWDGSGIAFAPDTWRALADLLLPGAFLFVFAGTVNDDLISVAMREAGLVKFHKMLAWIYGSGFPKATRIDIQIDEAAGAERRVIEIGRWANKARGNNLPVVGWSDPNNKRLGPSDTPITAPATPLARAWAGHRYGLQALKPSAETILIFRKPYDGGSVDSITQHGAGALWIDRGRIGTAADMNPNDFDDTKRTSPKFSGTFNNGKIGEYRARTGAIPNGRWPANFALSHHPDCVRAYGEEAVADWRCVEGCPVAALGEQSGDSLSSGFYEGDGILKNPSRGGRITNFADSSRPTTMYNDTGTAARYFFNADYAAERLEAADPVRYQAKAGRRERDAGLEGMPKRFLATMGDGIGAREHNPEEPTAYVRNTHPTQKPIALCKWLATLLLPPDEYAPRRLLIPFAGAASECIGALLAGWDEIVGIELEAEYVAIGRARLAWWADLLRWGHTDIDAMLRQWDVDDDDAGDDTDADDWQQMEMFG